MAGNHFIASLRRSDDRQHWRVTQRRGDIRRTAAGHRHIHRGGRRQLDQTRAAVGEPGRHEASARRIEPAGGGTSAGRRDRLDHALLRRQELLSDGQHDNRRLTGLCCRRLATVDGRASLAVLGDDAACHSGDPRHRGCRPTGSGCGPVGRRHRGRLHVLEPVGLPGPRREVRERLVVRTLRLGAMALSPVRESRRRLGVAVTAERAADLFRQGRAFHKIPAHIIAAGAKHDQRVCHGCRLHCGLRFGLPQPIGVWSAAVPLSVDAAFAGS